MSENLNVGIGQYIIGEFYLPTIDPILNKSDSGVMIPTSIFGGLRIGTDYYITNQYDLEFFNPEGQLYFDSSRGNVLEKIKLSIRVGLGPLIRESLISKYGFHDSFVFESKVNYSKRIYNQYGKILIQCAYSDSGLRFNPPEFLNLPPSGGFLHMWAESLQKTKKELDKYQEKKDKEEELKKRSNKLFP